MCARCALCHHAQEHPYAQAQDLPWIHSCARSTPAPSAPAPAPPSPSTSTHPTHPHLHKIHSAPQQQLPKVSGGQNCRPVVLQQHLVVPLRSSVPASSVTRAYMMYACTMSMRGPCLSPNGDTRLFMAHRAHAGHAEGASCEQSWTLCLRIIAAAPQQHYHLCVHQGRDSSSGSPLTAHHSLLLVLPGKNRTSKKQAQPAHSLDTPCSQPIAGRTLVCMSTH